METLLQKLQAIGGVPGQMNLNIVWTLVAAFLVFFMQAGFAMVETGFVRAKNAGNVLMKNLLDFAMGAIAFWMVGYGLMFGVGGNGFFGKSHFFINPKVKAMEVARDFQKDQGLETLGVQVESDADGNPVLLSLDPAIAVPEEVQGAFSAAIEKGQADNYWVLVFFLFQLVFAATAATIVSGAMAGRTKFTSYLVYSFFVSLVIYPISGKWAWGSLLNGPEAAGWLEKLGFIDFAGSGVVHMLGGILGLLGAIFLGPRLGKYKKDGTSRPIPGHNLPLAALGVFILWFGWYGFNPGSTTAGVPQIGYIAVTTTLAAAAGTIAALLTSWIVLKVPDIGMTLNGSLAGLVAITAGCAGVSPAAAILIGAVGGVLVVLSVLFVDHKLKIDDPVGAFSVHGVNGLWGVLAVGLFDQSTGLFTGNGWHGLGVQAIGVLAIGGWALVTGSILFGILKATMGLRVTKEEEIMGLDLGEHKADCYPDFRKDFTKV